MPTPVQHAEALISAIETLKRLEATGATPTPDDRASLAAFPGTGCVALDLFPDPTTGQYKNAAWQQRGEQLRNLCTDDEYDSLLRSTFSAFYTSPLVMDTAFALLRQLGVPDTARVLEPGSGSGNFLGRAPADMRFVGVELDRLSARIATLLYPQHDLRRDDLTTCRLPEGTLDAAVGNVPFADLHADYQGQRYSLHEVCLLRALDSLKPGGIAVLVMTHSFLDRQQARCRELVARKATLLGAIRLPSTAFAEQGTQVVADIVIFQKHLDGPRTITPGTEPLWYDSRPHDVGGSPMPVNAYFHTHPAMVLGTFSLGGHRLYAHSYSVQPTGDLATALATAIQALPTDVFPASAPTPEPDDADADVGDLRPLPDGTGTLPEGALYIDPRDGAICQRAGSGGVQVIYGGQALSVRKKGKTGRRLGALIRLREQVAEVLARQQAGRDAGDKQVARSTLLQQHAMFVHKYGPINKATYTVTASGALVRRTPNLACFQDDPLSMQVAALEAYDEDTGQATRQAIFLHDVVGQLPAPTHADSAEAALLLSLDQTGRVDLPLMADLYGHGQDVLLAELGELLYQDPTTQQWETADAYLSGNVRVKLAEARQAGPLYARHVAALEAVQPPDLLPSEIEANLGAPWLAPHDIAHFLRDLCEASDSWRCTITYVAREALWGIDADWRFAESPVLRTDYGTSRVHGVELLELALNLRVPTVKDPGGDGDPPVVNAKETAAARAKQEALKDAFQAWVWKDADRTERLLTRYNQHHNCLRLRQFDGGHLRFPGMAAHITLTPDQQDAAWRIMVGGNTLLGLATGGGKSFSMMAAGMKMRQAGMIRKPLYVVPNHMLEQFVRECLTLYPQARMLLAPSKAMSARKRQLLTARIVTGDWDGIITTHSAFGHLGLSVGVQASYLRARIAEYEALLTDAFPERTSSSDKRRGNIRKRLEKQKVAYEQELEDLLATTTKDVGLVFDELGIDYLFVDESVAFKGRKTPTKLEHVAGIQSDGSGRATDMDAKVRWLRETYPTRGVVTFATATPITNTMVELYTLQAYLDPEGVDHFDSWAATYGKIEEVMEIAPDGRNMRPRHRFAEFVNLSELLQRFHRFAIIRSQEQLQLDVPAVIGGQIQVVTCPLSPLQREVQDGLVERYDAIRAGQVKPWEDNALNVTNDGRNLALDARLLVPGAEHDEDGKLQRCADQVLRIYHATRESRATQLIFCDRGIHPTDWGFSAYESLRALLIAGGIPAAEVRCMQEAKTDGAKYHLQSLVQQGQVAVLLGSTETMGTGLNVQHRLLALHHLDIPWTPDRVTQRNGRIVRQGNMHKEVSLFAYVTAGSFDAYMWQTLETKARFIGQIMHGSLTQRRARDLDEQTLSFAEVKAIASGNPAMLVLAKVEAECRHLRLLQQHHQDAQFRAQQKVKGLPQDIAGYERRLTGYHADLEALATSSPADPWYLEASVPQLALALPEPAPDGEPVPPTKPRTPQEEAETRLTLWGQTLQKSYVPQELPVGRYRGLQVLYCQQPMGHDTIRIQGQVGYDLPIDRRMGLGRAIVRGVMWTLEQYPGYATALEAHIQEQRRALAKYEASVGQVWPHGDYLQQLGNLRRELALALRSDKPEEAREAGAVVVDIEALQASHKVERQEPSAGPERTLSLAEPITAQIRARHAAQATAD